MAVLHGEVPKDSCVDFPENSSMASWKIHCLFSIGETSSHLQMFFFPLSSFRGVAVT